MKEINNIWLNGIIGLVVGDALGCPVEFSSRSELEKSPVYDMESYGTFNLPAGTWTDDSSMTLATLDSIKEKFCIDSHDIMSKFHDWIFNGKYTPFGNAFDVGNTTIKSIMKYTENKDIYSCGGALVNDNGNGSLMRILPICIYTYEQKLSNEEAIRLIHEVSGLTHNHLRSKIACGLYYFCVSAILNGNGDLIERLQNGIDNGFNFYKRNIANLAELSYYGRIKNLFSFASISKDKIKSSGYVVDTMEAAIWSLINTNNFMDCELEAVNLGGDTDTIAAIAGGLAGLYYGYNNIPQSWLTVIQKREWIEELCKSI